VAKVPHGKIKEAELEEANIIAMPFAAFRAASHTSNPVRELDLFKQ
jgi:hypothetical protein